MYTVIYDDGLEVNEVEVDDENLGEFIRQIDCDGFRVIDIQKSHLTIDEYHDSPYDLDDPLHHLNDPARWD